MRRGGKMARKGTAGGTVARRNAGTDRQADASASPDGGQGNEGTEGNGGNGQAPTAQATPTIPDVIAAALPGAGIRAAGVRLCEDTDLDLAGNDARQWLVATNDRLATFAVAGGRAAPLVQLAYDGLRGARADSRVGSGMLEVEVAPGAFQDVLRYSNARAATFGRFARKLHRRLKEGRPLVVTAEDTWDTRQCIKCGRPVLSSAGATVAGAGGRTYRVCPRCVSKGQVALRLLALMRPYWPFAVVVLLLLGLTIGLDLVPPRLTRLLVDTVFGDHPPAPWFAFLADAFGVAVPTGETAERSDRIGVLILLVLLLASTQLSKVLVTVANGALSTHIGTRITYDLRLHLYRRLQEQGVAYYDQQSVGILMTRVAQDTEELHGFISHVTSGFLVQIVLLVAVGITLFTINARLAVFTLLPAPLVVGTTFAYWRFVRPRYYHFSEQRARLSSVLYATLSGVRVVKAFGQEWREVGRFTGAAERLRRARIAVDRSQTTYYPLVSFVFSLGGYIVWYTGGQSVLGVVNGEEMTLGTLLAFFGYLGLFYAPMNQLTHIGQWLTSFVTAAYRLFDVLDAEPQVTTAADASSLPAIAGSIEFDRVTFGYDPHYPVLHDVSLRIEPGEMIGIVGPSGSGKSTLINLLCRFYDPTEGTIRIDGVDLRRVHNDDLRRHVGLVLQDPFLFRGTVRENLAYGRPNASMEDVIRAATAANTHQFIMRLPDGYDTRLGESGSGLSGGEKQRLSIARALLCDPRILILDEATSSVDTESERAIQNALEVLTKGRTTVAIAHRLSTLRNADRIVVMEQGRVKELGTHTELMALGGLYHRLVTIQLQLSKTISLANVEHVAPDAATNGSPATGAPKGTKAPAQPSSPSQSSDAPAFGAFAPARFLSPGEFTLDTLPNGALRVTLHGSGNGEEHGEPLVYDYVRVYQALPLTEPGTYVALRHGQGPQRELGIIRRLADLSRDQQRLLAEALRRRYISQIIVRIDAINQEFGLLEWHVLTDRGPRDFSLPQSASYVVEYGALGEGRIVFDIYGNRYLIPNIHHLDPRSLSLFRRHVYW
ncbi:MAG: DUF1854 domain-containing protein [Chloroflexi bacterium]|nr:DUF1854 domain-containing protein [Chloroflexota bacterium]